MADAVVMTAAKALAAAFGAIGRLKWWPGDRVRAYGVPGRYVRLVHGFHVVSFDGREQLCPPESVR
jgi:hypothetical protein